MNSETNRIEYKQELTDDLEKEAIAFLNYHEGGVIYIGIDKKGKPIGVSDIDGEMLKIKDRLKNNIMPSCMGLFDVSAEDINSKNVSRLLWQVERKSRTISRNLGCRKEAHSFVSGLLPSQCP
jgi:hypothetical protein